MSHKYQNISNSVQMLSNIGVFQPNEEIVTDHIIENPNFKYIGETDAVQETPANPDPAPITEENN